MGEPEPQGRGHGVRGGQRPGGRVRDRVAGVRAGRGHRGEGAGRAGHGGRGRDRLEGDRRRRQRPGRRQVERFVVKCFV